MTQFESFMSGWGWAVFCLVSAFFSAGVSLINQYMKQPGHFLVFWSRVWVVLVLAPLIAQMTMPTDPLFYGAVLLTALLGVTADIRTFNVAARYGGGVVLRVQPLIVFLSFFLWFFFDPHMLGKYIAHPFNTAGILVALLGCAYFSARLRKCHISRAAFTEMLPVRVCYSLTTVLGKYAMTHGPLTGAVYGYMFAQSAIGAAMIGGYSIWLEGKPLPAPVVWRTKKMLIASLLAGFGWILSMTFKNYAMAFIPNPSYQAAINQTSPVFVAIFYWLVKHKEEADVASGMGVVASATLLALMAV